MLVYTMTEFSCYLFHCFLQLLVVLLHLILPALQSLYFIVQLHHFRQFLIDIGYSIL